MKVATSGGFVYNAAQTFDQQASFATAIASENIDINASNNSIDNTHILLKGTLPAGHNYIDCVNSTGTTLFKVDKDGEQIITWLNCFLYDWRLLFF